MFDFLIQIAQLQSAWFQNLISADAILTHVFFCFKQLTTMKALILFVGVCFIFFELASCQTGVSPTTASSNENPRFLIFPPGTGNAANSLLGNLGFGTPGVGSLSYLDPSLLILSQLLSQNISLNCLFLLSSLFGPTGSPFPVSNLQSSIIPAYNPQSVTVQQVLPLLRDASSQRALPRVLSGCNIFGESTSSLLSFLYFVLLSGNTPTSPVTCYNSRPFFGGKYVKKSSLLYVKRLTFRLCLVLCKLFSRSKPHKLLKDFEFFQIILLKNVKL